MPISCRWILSICIAMMPSAVFCQDCVTINMPDTVIGCPDSVASVTATLTVRPGLTVVDTNWVPTTGVSDASSLNPTFTGIQPVLYSLQVFTLTDTDHIINGSFNDSNFAFTTEYTTQEWGTDPGHYAITKSLPKFHALFPNIGDHTTGNGYMMLVDGSLDPSMYFWAQTVNVTPSTYYEFSFWASTILVPPARIKTVINNRQVYSLQMEDTNSIGQWKFYHVTWYSGSASTAAIYLYSLNHETQGNDFVIDDIKFRNVCKSSKDVYVELCMPPVNPHIFGLPTAFSPNGDGKNDILYAHGSEFEGFTLIVFDRLGKKVFETNNLNSGWDGNYNGQPLPMDTYCWVVKITFLDKQTIKRMGNVTLLR